MMLINTGQPKIHCDKEEPHDEHFWSHIVNEDVGRSHPDGWEWAYCSGQVQV